MRKTLKDRLLVNSYIEVDDRLTNGQPCWISTYALDNKDVDPLTGVRSGYPQISVNGVNRKAHRVSYEITYGAVPEGLVLDHVCKNKRCIEPTHLEPVTTAVNNLRIYQQGAPPRRPRLGMKKARMIRADYATGKYSQIDLAIMYNISRPTITDITTGRRYREK